MRPGTHLQLAVELGRHTDREARFGIIRDRRPVGFRLGQSQRRSEGMSEQLRNSPSRIRSGAVEQSSEKNRGGGADTLPVIPVLAGRKLSWERPTVRVTGIEQVESATNPHFFESATYIIS